MGGWLSRDEVDAAAPETPDQVADGIPKATRPSMRLETQVHGPRHTPVARALPRAASSQRSLGARATHILGSAGVPTVSDTRREESASCARAKRHPCGSQPVPGCATAMPRTTVGVVRAPLPSAPDPCNGGTSAQFWPGGALPSVLQPMPSENAASAVVRLTSCLALPCSQMHPQRPSCCGRRCLRTRPSGRTPP